MQENHFIDIYRQQAAAYERMIDAEDVDGNLRRALNEVAVLSARPVLDLGSGSGRIPQLLHGQTTGVGLDLHRAMLLENRRQQRAQHFYWPLIEGDIRALPFAADCAGVVIAGWAIGHFCAWYRDNWPANIRQALGEMLRVAQARADVIVLETLGTGVLHPAPPSPDLEAYYQLLEGEWGFQRHVIQTDYQFSSVEEAVAAMSFFFGEELARDIRRNGWQRVPEWTGMWHLRCAA